MRNRLTCGLGAASFLLSTSVAASCGATFCLVNTDWSVQGVYAEPGTRFDLRYEAIDLDQPRSGRNRVSVGEIPRHHDEVLTENRNWVATIDHNLSPAFGISLAIPFVDRYHEHVHNHRGEQIVEQWNFTDPGDIRVLGRYQFAHSLDDQARSRSAGVIAGLKLPTGKFDVTNEEGAVAERTLQPGTGTTDLVLGLYVSAAAPLEDLAWFAQAGGVIPLNTRDAFKPGKQLAIDAGVRYAMSDATGLMLQLNYQAKGRDSGDNAEPEDSGQRQLFLTPGISWTVSKSAQLYAFVQVPLYQSVNGVQLTADVAVLVGISGKF